jgi:hypothetical protein
MEKELYMAFQMNQSLQNKVIHSAEAILPLEAEQ